MHSSFHTHEMDNTDCKDIHNACTTTITSTSSNSRVSTPSRCMSSVSSASTLLLDNLQTHHTQALVNIVSSTLYSTPIDVSALDLALKDLRRHLESPQSYANAHPATKTNAIEVLEHIVVCWVCAQASQADAQNYNIESVVDTNDGLFDKYAQISESTAMEAVYCISYLATMSIGTAAVARSSIPTSLVLAIGFAQDKAMLTSVFRTLTKLCTKHSVRRAKADGRWESETGIYAVIDAFTRAKKALFLRNRFDTLGNAAFLFISEYVSLSFPHHSHSGYEEIISKGNSNSVVDPPSEQGEITKHSNDRQASLLDRTVASALALTNAIAEACGTVDERLRIRKELLETPLYKCLKLLEEPELAGCKAHQESKRFRYMYSSDIRLHNPAASPEH